MYFNIEQNYICWLILSVTYILISVLNYNFNHQIIKLTFKNTKQKSIQYIPKILSIL